MCAVIESWARSTELLVNYDWSRAMEVTGVLECEMFGSWVNRNSTQRMRDAFEQSVTVKRRRNAVATSLEHEDCVAVSGVIRCSASGN